MCDDFFIVIVDAIPAKSAFGKSKKGEAALEELLSTLQDMHCGSGSGGGGGGGGGEGGGGGGETWLLKEYADIVPQTAAQKAETAAARAAKAAKAAAVKKAAAKGGKKTAAKAAKMESVLADRWFSPFAARDGRLASGCHLWPCPTCVELSTGLAHADYIAKIDEIPTVLTPSVAYSWGKDEESGEPEMAPLYMNMQAKPLAKPKWTLVQGLGPPTLEVDRSRTGRVFKPSLRQFGIEHDGFQRRVEKEGISIEPSAYALMIDSAYWTVAALGVEQGSEAAASSSGDGCSGRSGAGTAAQAARGVSGSASGTCKEVVSRWFAEHAPLFLSWDAVAADMLLAPSPRADGADREQEEPHRKSAAPPAPGGGAKANLKKEKRKTKT